MRTDSLTLRIGLVLSLAVALDATSSAHHTATHNQNPSPATVSGANPYIHFAAGSIIIPMDACYDRMSFISNAEQTSIVSPDTTASLGCQSNSEKDDGLIPSYSLVFRLIKDGIPVNWIIKGSKTGWNDPDFTVTKSGGGAVYWKAGPLAATSTTKFSSVVTMKYRGAPFVIDSAYAAAALTKMATYAGAHSEYTQVDLHVAQVGFDAPVYKTISKLPKIAVIDLTGSDFHQEKTLFVGDLISDAVMTDLAGSLWDYVTFAQVKAGGLANYDLAWVPSFDTDLGTLPSASDTTFMTAMNTFADGGGSILWEDAAVGAVEGYGSSTCTPAASTSCTYTASKAGMKNYMVNTGGIVADGVSSTYDNGSSTEFTQSEDYSDPASQFGGDVWTGIGGSKYNWMPRYDMTYKAGVRRMVYSAHTTTDSKRRWDFATWRKYNNDSTKGTIYYLGGDHWRKNTASGFRIVMNTVLTTVAVTHTSTIEVTRSSPIIATVGGVTAEYVGSLEETIPPTGATTWSSSANNGTFSFPAVQGHMRAVNLALVSTGETSFASATAAIVFDAANGIPSINYTGSGCGAFPITDHAACRRIFTDTGSATNPTETMVVTANHTTLMSSLGASNTTDADTLIGRIHAGILSGGSYVAKLGGVDRSTPAVIEASPLIANNRPTMVYFGARDGMLHAVCAEAKGQCPAVGKELWAYLPSSEIGKVRLNSARIDGSPKVADIYGSFNGAARTVKTILTFQTGNSSGAAATYAMDVSDPANPNVIWKVTTPGAGLTSELGWVHELAAIKSFTFIQSGYDATGPTAGFEVRAIDTATGEVRWTKQYPYSVARTSGNPDVPYTGIPGGVSLIQTDGATTDSLLVPTLYGQVYRLDPLTGDNKLGTIPLFDFNEDFHPIGAGVTLYRDSGGTLHGLVVSGGYVDITSPSASAWAPDNVHQYAVGFPALSTTTVRRSDVASDSTLGVYLDFGAGQRAFSPAVVAGSELLATTDNSSVNASDYESGTSSTGTLWRQSLTNSATSTQTAIRSGAGSVDVQASTGTVVTAGKDGIVVTKPAGFTATGTGVESTPSSSSSRRLWLRLR